MSHHVWSTNIWTQRKKGGEREAAAVSGRVLEGEYKLNYTESWRQYNWLKWRVTRGKKKRKKKAAESESEVSKHRAHTYPAKKAHEHRHCVGALRHT